MDLLPSEEQVLLRDMVRRFLADRQDANTMGRGPIAREDWLALGELGLFAFLLPENAGGMGGGVADALIVAEEFGRGLAITPLAESVLLCAELIAQHGTPDQIERWVKQVVQGEAILAFAQGVSAWRNGDAWILDGAAGLVRDGAGAAAILVTTDNSQLLLVDAKAAGVVRTPVRLADGSAAADLRFDGAPSTLISASPEHVSAAIGRAELAIVSELVGLMATLYEMTVNYVKQRRQFGVAIGSFQVVQHRCARLFMLLEQSRSMLLKAAFVEEYARERAIVAARAYVSDASLKLAEEVVQLHGGMGVTDELPVGRGLRRILVLSKLFGGAASARAALAA